MQLELKFGMHVSSDVETIFCSFINTLMLGYSMMSLCYSFRDIIRNAVHASEHDSVIFVGSGCTGAVHKLIHALNLQKPPVSLVVIPRLALLPAVYDRDINWSPPPWPSGCHDIILLFTFSYNMHISCHEVIMSWNKKTSIQASVVLNLVSNSSRASAWGAAGLVFDIRLCHTKRW